MAMELNQNKHDCTVLSSTKKNCGIVIKVYTEN